MLKNILQTLGTRSLMLVINFFIVIATTQLLGASGKGAISVLVLNITVVITCCGFMGGSAMVYLAPRFPVFRILAAGYLWSTVAAVGVSGLLHAFGQIPEGGFSHVLVNSLLEAYYVVNLMTLLGKENIKAHNGLSLLRIATLFLGFLGLLAWQADLHTLGYVWALYLSNGLAWLVSFVPLTRYVALHSLRGLGTEFKAMLHYGFAGQLANLAQLMVYRLSYYLIGYFAPSAASGDYRIGIYATGMHLAEAFWVISRSIAMVLYARVSNLDDRAASADITLTLLKVSFLLVIALLLPALLVPDALYAVVFGEEFFRVKAVLWYLSPGIASIAVNGILSHYFSGTGRPAINARAAGLGLLITLVLGVILIPEHPITGAGITASVAYGVSTIYLLVRFLRDSGRGWRALGVTRAEWTYLRQVFRQRTGGPQTPQN